MATTTEQIDHKGRSAEPKISKIEMVKELEAMLDMNSNMIVTDYAGLSVEKMTEFRKKLYEEKLQYRVVKNTLFKIALENKNMTSLGDYITGPSAILFAGEDIVAAAKLLKDINKEIGIKVKGGFAEGKALSQKEVEAYADLPSRPELYSKLLGTMQSPMRGFVTVLSGPLAGFCRILKQVAEKKGA